MGKSRKAFSPWVRAWVEASDRFRLWHAQVQMAGELGLNPGKVGKISNRRQEPWTAPLPQFIENLYLKRFGRERPGAVTAAEEWDQPAAAKNRRGLLSPRMAAVSSEDGGCRDRAR